MARAAVMSPMCVISLVEGAGAGSSGGAADRHGCLIQNVPVQYSCLADHTRPLLFLASPRWPHVDHVVGLPHQADAAAHPCAPYINHCARSHR